MARHDVVIIGAGAAGLSAGALLAKEGKSVLIVEASPWLGGRGVAVPDEGFKINLGGHLVEDSGSGITKVFEHVGKELIHGASSSDMVIWDHERSRWGSIREQYSADKSELKKLIQIVVETPYEEFDKWDDRTLREWMLQYTTHEGVINLWEFITVLEAITENWWDHSASDNLYMRKMHYSEKGIGGYSFWPGQGWDGMFNDLRDAVVENGGEVRLNTRASRAVIEDGKLLGLAVANPHVLPNEIFEETIIETDCLISTLPVWNVLRVVPESDLPDWYAEQIKHLARIEFRATWLGVYFATKEPIHALDPRELATWLHTPNLPHAGFFFNMSAMDPSVAPDGSFLYVGGLDIPARRCATSSGCCTPRSSSRRTWRSCIRGSDTPTGAGATWCTSPASASSRSPTWLACSARIGAPRTSTGCTSPLTPSARAASASTAPPALALPSPRTSSDGAFPRSAMDGDIDGG